MRSLLLFGAIFGLALAEVPVGKTLVGLEEELQEYHGHGNAPTEKLSYMTPLNPFDSSDPRQLHLKYEANLRFFQKGAPIFINPYYGKGNIQSGLIHDLAEELNGALVTADTRFTEDNRPKNTSEEYHHLNSYDYVIADVAQLVTKVRQDLRSPESKVILFGLYKGATISVLARKYYPHLIDGAYSTSGFFTFETPVTIHYKKSSQNLYDFDEDCANAMKIALEKVVALVKDKQYRRISELFNLCPGHNFQHPQDANAFLLSIYNYVAFRISGYKDVKTTCDVLTTGPDPFTAFFRFINHFYHNRHRCRNLNYADELAFVKRLGFAHVSRCTETGQGFYVTTKDSGIFPDALDKSLYEALCRDALGPNFKLNWHQLNIANENFNTRHGGKKQIVSNTIFSIADRGSLMDFELEDVGSSEIVRTKFHDEGEDMKYSISNYDSVDLHAVKTKILNYLRNILREEEAQPDSS